MKFIEDMIIQGW